MNFPIIISGIAGTLAMTLFIEFICLLTHKPFHVIRILAYMIPFGRSVVSTNARRMIYVAAVEIHYAIGVLFTFCFKQCIQSNLMEFTFSNALLFGALAGFVGIIGWRIVFAVHPEPPKIRLSQYLTVIWIGHIVFSIVQFYSLLLTT